MRVRALLAGLMLAIAAGSAEATVTVARSPAIAPDLGNVISGSSVTVWSVTTDGVATRISGNAIRVNRTNVTVPTITITCTLSLDLCVTRQMQVTIQPVAGSGAGSITMFRVGSLTTATFRDGAPAAAASMTFVLNAFGLGSATFLLGMDISLAAAAVSGQTQPGYTVSVTLI